MKLVNLKKVLILVLVLNVAFLYASLSSMAMGATDHSEHSSAMIESNHSQHAITVSETDQIIKGSVHVHLSINKENAKIAKETSEKVLQTVREETKNQLNIEQDSSKKALLGEQLEGQEDITVDKLFIDNMDGSTTAVTNAPFLTVKLGDYSTLTDEDGQFVLPSDFKEGEYQISLLLEDHPIYESTIKVSHSDPLEIVIHQDDAGLEKAAERMAGIDTQKEEKTLDSFLLEATVSAASGSILFPQYTTGTYIPWATGSGGMKVVANGNIVHCNKADKVTSDGSYGTSSFPWNNSDCAQAISLGLAYSLSPQSMINYSYSYYCYIEGVSSMLNDNSGNIYCNGTYKSGHYNCSWFYGINHTEALHYHY